MRGWYSPFHPRHVQVQVLPFLHRAMPVPVDVCCSQAKSLKPPSPEQFSKDRYSAAWLCKSLQLQFSCFQLLSVALLILLTLMSLVGFWQLQTASKQQNQVCIFSTLFILGLARILPLQGEKNVSNERNFFMYSFWLILVALHGFRNLRGGCENDMRSTDPREQSNMFQLPMWCQELLSSLPSLKEPKDSLGLNWDIYIYICIYIYIYTHAPHTHAQKTWFCN